MVKKISCRVVSTAALSKSNDALRRASGAGAGDIRVGHNDNSVTYASWLDIAEISIDDSPMGQILDCYA